VASLVFWFGLDDWVIDQINREATRILMPFSHVPYGANLHKWGLAQSPSSDRPWNHIVDTCPLTKFEGGLNLLYEVDDDAIMWLESTAAAALVK